MKNSIIEQYADEKFLKADGFDEAIIGVCQDFNAPVRLIYSVSKCIKILMRDMSYEDAMEHFNFNVSGSYMGKKTPVWCWDDFPEYKETRGKKRKRKRKKKRNTNN